MLHLQSNMQHSPLGINSVSYTLYDMFKHTHTHHLYFTIKHTVPACKRILEVLTVSVTARSSDAAVFSQFPVSCLGLSDLFSAGDDFLPVQPAGASLTHPATP